MWDEDDSSLPQCYQATPLYMRCINNIPDAKAEFDARGCADNPCTCNGEQPEGYARAMCGKFVKTMVKEYERIHYQTTRLMSK